MKCSLLPVALVGLVGLVGLDFLVQCFEVIPKNRSISQSGVLLVGTC